MILLVGIECQNVGNLITVLEKYRWKKYAVVYGMGGTTILFFLHLLKVQAGTST